MTTDTNGMRRKLRSEGSADFKDDPFIIGLLRSLDELERQTDPRRPQSDKGKDVAATEALRLAADLAAYVSGWAVDHKVGLGAASFDNLLDMPDLLKSTVFMELQEKVDSHDHEEAGLSPEQISADGKRRAFANLFEYRIGGILEQMRASLGDGLKALQFGEQLPILQPVRSGRKRSLEQLKLQLYAHGYIEYKHAMGTPKNESYERVEEEYGVDGNTARNWLRALRQWNFLYVDRFLHRARCAGMHAKENSSEAIFDSAVGDAALIKNGRHYKRAAGFKAPKQ